MKILFITHSFNSLTQRLFVELMQDGHEVSVELDINDSVTTEAVDLFNPDLIIAPFLKRAIPSSIWMKKICFIVHPGVAGDRGPSALDWAILNREKEWGVTILQAEKEMDAGPVWATANFKMRDASKSSIYRNEVTEAAVHAVKEAIDNFEKENYSPLTQDYSNTLFRGRIHRPIIQSDRKIIWQDDDVKTVLRKINSADGNPGLLENLLGEDFFLYGATPDDLLSGEPGKIIGRNDSSIAIACKDGAVWISHLKRKNSSHAIKLPADLSLGENFFQFDKIQKESNLPTEEIYHRVKNDVIYFHFDFYNGALSSKQCEKLIQRFKEIKRLPQKIVVLFGGKDFWSNGIHLNVIEHSDRPAEESLVNINAINEVAKEIITTDDKIIISAVRGNCAAGGVFLALAADFVWARTGVILNPHYKNMGNLYGSEYWTYHAEKRKEKLNLSKIMQKRLPIGTAEAKKENLIDDHFGDDVDAFELEVVRRAGELSNNPKLSEMISQKKLKMNEFERVKPLEKFREEEIEKMKLNFFGFDSSYHVARFNFVHRVPHSKTPLYLAKHRKLMEN